MSLEVKNSTMVYPALETPRVSLWLSRIDMVIRQPFSHTHLFYVYHHPTTNNDDIFTNFFDTHVMKESLSRVLVPFYPVAGRLRFNNKNDRYEINCNAKGALFIEAEARAHALADFGDYSAPNNELREMVFPTIDYSGGLSSFPLLIVQLTRFNCGGVCLGVMTHHHVNDGTSYAHFMDSWTRLAKGLDLRVYPVHDRATYFAPRHPPQVKFQHKEFDHPSLFRKDSSSDNKVITAIESVFKITKDQINALKLQATIMSSDDELSTFALLAGHVWRSACKARGLAHDQHVQLYVPVDVRSRFKDPTLPQGYFGNAIFATICIEKVGDIISNPIWYVASKIQRTLKRMQDVEYLRSAIDYLESYPDPNSLVRGPGFVASPNLSINSWARLPLKETDFGWGGPGFISIRGIKFEGQTYLMPSPNDDGGFLVAIKLLAHHKDLFEKYLYEFESSSSITPIFEKSLGNLRNLVSKI